MANYVVSLWRRVGTTGQRPVVFYAIGKHGLAPVLLLTDMSFGYCLVRWSDDVLCDRFKWGIGRP